MRTIIAYFVALVLAFPALAQADENDTLETAKSEVQQALEQLKAARDKLGAAREEARAEKQAEGAKRQPDQQDTASAEFKTTGEENAADPGPKANKRKIKERQRLVDDESVTASSEIDRQVAPADARAEKKRLASLNPEQGAQDKRQAAFEKKQQRLEKKRLAALAAKERAEKQRQAALAAKERAEKKLQGALAAAERAEQQLQAILLEQRINENNTPGQAMDKSDNGLGNGQEKKKRLATNGNADGTIAPTTESATEN